MSSLKWSQSLESGQGLGKGVGVGVGLGSGSGSGSGFWGLAEHFPGQHMLDATLASVTVYFVQSRIASAHPIIIRGSKGVEPFRVVCIVNEREAACQ